MNVLLVFESVPRAIKYLQECRVWASTSNRRSAGVRCEYTGRDALRFQVGKSLVFATSARTVDVARGQVFNLAYLCGINEPGRCLDNVLNVVSGSEAEVVVKRYPPLVDPLMGYLFAIEQMRGSFKPSLEPGAPPCQFQREYLCEFVTSDAPEPERAPAAEPVAQRRVEDIEHMPQRHRAGRRHG